MTTVADVMTRGVRTMSPSDTVVKAAQAMDELNVGVIPVCEGEKLVGMVTDRDIVVRGVAQECDAKITRLADVMSTNVRCATEDQDVDEVPLGPVAGQRQGRRRLEFRHGRRAPLPQVRTGDSPAQLNHAMGGTVRRLVCCAHPTRRQRLHADVIGVTAQAPSGSYTVGRKEPPCACQPSVKRNTRRAAPQANLPPLRDWFADW